MSESNEALTYVDTPTGIDAAPEDAVDETIVDGFAADFADALEGPPEPIVAPDDASQDDNEPARTVSQFLTDPGTLARDEQASMTAQAGEAVKILEKATGKTVADLFPLGFPEVRYADRKHNPRATRDRARFRVGFDTLGRQHLWIRSGVETAGGIDPACPASVGRVITMGLCAAYAEQSTSNESERSVLRTTTLGLVFNPLDEKGNPKAGNVRPDSCFVEVKDAYLPMVDNVADAATVAAYSLMESPRIKGSKATPVVTVETLQTWTDSKDKEKNLVLRIPGAYVESGSRTVADLIAALQTLDPATVIPMEGIKQTKP